MVEQKSEASPPSELSSAEKALEKQIQVEKAVEEYNKLPKTDKQFIGIETDTKKFWILGESLNIKQLGVNSNKKLQEMFAEYDNPFVELQETEGQTPELAAKRTKLLMQREIAKRRIIDEAIPMMLSDDSKSGFDKNHWFSDKFPVAVWWGVALDCNLFLAESGSKEDIVQSMML